LLNLDDMSVTHDEDRQRFSLNGGGQIALLAYSRRPGLLSLDHTEVPRAIQNQGVAAKLTRAALDFARAENLRVVPSCSYAAAFIRKHAEYQDLVAPGKS
jgi:predicted GNAT family acetyltransferase